MAKLVSERFECCHLLVCFAAIGQFNFFFNLNIVHLSISLNWLNIRSYFCTNQYLKGNGFGFVFFLFLIFLFSNRIFHEIKTNSCYFNI